MNNKDFIRKAFFTKRNLKYLFKHFFCNETIISIGKSEAMTINSRKQRVFNVYCEIENCKFEGYALPLKNGNGFVLFNPKEEEALRVTFRYKINIKKEKCPIEKRAKLEYFKKNSKGKYFKGAFGRFVKEETAYAWCC